MKLLFLHGWNSVVGGVKPTFLASHGFDVLNPALPDEDFAEAVRIAQAEFDRHGRASSSVLRGGAVAMNVRAGQTPLVLLCPAWKRWGTAKTVNRQTVILHSRADDVIPFADSADSGKPLFLTSSSLSANGITSSDRECRITVPGLTGLGRAPSFPGRTEQDQRRVAGLKVHRHGSAARRADNHARSVPIKLGLRDANGLGKVLIRQSGVQHFVAVPGEKRRLDAPPEPRSNREGKVFSFDSCGAVKLATACFCARRTAQRASRRFSASTVRAGLQQIAAGDDRDRFARIFRVHNHQPAHAILGHSLGRSTGRLPRVGGDRFTIDQVVSDDRAGIDRSRLFGPLQSVNHPLVQKVARVTTPSRSPLSFTTG